MSCMMDISSRLPIALVAVIVGVSSSSNAAILRVDGESTASVPDGEQWETAFADLQDALQQANAGDEIWVADGVYKPTTTDNRGISFNIGLNDLKIYGGFQGISHPDGPETEDDIEDRNPLFFESVLSGDIGVQGDHADNSIHVVVIAAVDDGMLLDGFTIRDGNGQVNAAVASPGGGLFMDNAAARIVRCTFIDNSTHVPNGETAGGAAYAFSHCGGCGGAPWFINCTFRSNFAPRGGALTIQGSTDIVRVVNCVFQDNVATMNSGGALLLLDGGRVTIINSTFTGNSAPSTAGGGAIAVLDNTVELQVHNSILWNDSPNEIDNSVNVKLRISYSDVEGGAEGTGNIAIDPEFVNVAAGDLRLQSGSDAINAALNGNIPADAGDLNQDGNRSESTPVDALLKLRIVTSTVDMGAYEFRPCSADLPGDGNVGSADLAELLAAWGNPGCDGAIPCAADQSNDGAVESADLAELLAQWGPCPGGEGAGAPEGSDLQDVLEILGFESAEQFVEWTAAASDEELAAIIAQLQSL